MISSFVKPQAVKAATVLGSSSRASLSLRCSTTAAPLTISVAFPQNRLSHSNTARCTHTLPKSVNAVINFGVLGSFGDSVTLFSTTTSRLPLLRVVSILRFIRYPKAALKPLSRCTSVVNVFETPKTASISAVCVHSSGVSWSFLTDSWSAAAK